MALSAMNPVSSMTNTGCAGGYPPLLALLLVELSLKMKERKQTYLKRNARSFSLDRGHFRSINAV